MSWDGTTPGESFCPGMGESFCPGMGESFCPGMGESFCPGIERLQGVILFQGRTTPGSNSVLG